MIGISYIEEKDYLIQNVKKENFNQIIISNTDIQIDEFNFDNNSFNDFIDYLDFQGYEKYIFLVKNSFNRLFKIVDFLENEVSDIEFYIIDEKLSILYGSTDIINILPPEIAEIDDNNQLDASQTPLLNGLMTLFTGVYPHTINRNLLKHIYVNNIEILKEINTDIWLNMAINSSIFINEPEYAEYLDDEIFNTIPTLSLFNDTIKNFDLDQLILIRKSHLEDMIETFKKLSVINNDQQKKGIIDYATLTETYTNNRLFFFEDGVYSDYSKTLKLSPRCSVGYFDILSKSNAANNIASDYESIIKNIFPLMFNLASVFPDKDCTLINPYTQNKLKSVMNKSVNFSLIGIKSTQGCFAYNLLENRVFQTNELFLEVLEFDQKEQRDLLKNHLKDQYEEIMGEYKELISSGK